MSRQRSLKRVPAALRKRDGAAQRERLHSQPEPYLTSDEAVAYLNLGSTNALYRLIREWGLPYGRMGREYRFNRRQLDAWVERRSIESLATARSA